MKHFKVMNVPSPRLTLKVELDSENFLKLYDQPVSNSMPFNVFNKDALLHFGTKIREESLQELNLDPDRFRI